MPCLICNEIMELSNRQLTSWAEASRDRPMVQQFRTQGNTSLWSIPPNCHWWGSVCSKLYSATFHAANSEENGLAARLKKIIITTTTTYCYRISKKTNNLVDSRNHCLGLDASRPAQQPQDVQGCGIGIEIFNLRADFTLGLKMKTKAGRWCMRRQKMKMDGQEIWQNYEPRAVSSRWRYRFWDGHRFSSIFGHFIIITQRLLDWRNSIWRLVFERNQSAIKIEFFQLGKAFSYKWKIELSIEN